MLKREQGLPGTGILLPGISEVLRNPVAEIVGRAGVEVEVPLDLKRLPMIGMEIPGLLQDAVSALHEEEVDSGVGWYSLEPVAQLGGGNQGNIGKFVGKHVDSYGLHKCHMAQKVPH